MNIKKTLERVMMKVEGNKNSNLVMSDKTYNYKLPAKTIASKIKVITVK